MVARVSRTALSIAMIVAVLATLVMQSQRYFWCPTMLVARAACCCPSSEPKAPSEGPVAERAACCEERAVAPLDGGTMPADPPLSVAVAVSPAWALTLPEATRWRVMGASPEPLDRARRSAPLPARGPPHALNCVYLI